MTARRVALLLALVACGAPEAPRSLEAPPTAERAPTSSTASTAPLADPVPASSQAPDAPELPDLDAVLGEPHPTFVPALAPIVQGDVLGALARAASCESFVAMDGAPSSPALRCACRSLCGERFPSVAATVTATVPGAGLAFEIAPSGEVKRCRFEPDDTRVDCPADEPTVAGASVEHPVDPAPARRRLREGIDLEGLQRSVMHEHGGAAATVSHGDVELRLQVPITLELRSAWVVRRHCRSTGWETAKPGKNLTLARNGKPVPPGKLALPAGDHVLSIGFDGVPVYQACDHFGFRYRLLVSGPAAPGASRAPAAPVEIELEGPLHVTRIEPLRRP